MGSGMKPILVEDFLKRTNFSLNNLGIVNLHSLQCVIGLREMKEILDMKPMSKDYLHQLLYSTGLAGSFERKIYQKSNIYSRKIDPRALYVGQKYVYRNNYQTIVENFKNIFEKFCVSSGIAQLTPYIVFGKDQNNNLSLAHYVPPIIEKHDGQFMLLDGVHRNYIMRASGSTIESIIIENVDAPFPCSAKNWNEVKVIAEKPSNIEDRYFDLKPELFRDLKSIGIDG